MKHIAEDIFDIATPEELVRLFEDEEGMVIARRYMTPDYNMAKLATVYHWRGKTKKSHGCLAQIQDVGRRFDTNLLLHECIK